jgi:hypothetical protein
MKEAEHRLRQAKGSAIGDNETARLGGITRLVGMVYDTDQKDIILIGQADAKEQPLTLDDLVVAIKALMVRKQWPLVSIDVSPQTVSSQQQVVRFEGGVENSGFGKAMLEADVCLKELALGRRSAEVWGLKSYFDRIVEATRASGSPGPGNVRFWFEPIEPNITALDRVYVINELRIGVSAKFSGDVTNNESKDHDAVAETFANDFTSAFGDIATAFPEVARLKQIFALTAIARGIQSLPFAPVDFWTNRYKPANMLTSNAFPVLSREQAVEQTGKSVDLKLSGGVKMNALVLRLRDGDATALYDAVLNSRPLGNPLSWQIPLDGWTIPGYGDETAHDTSSKIDEASSQDPAGCTFTRSISLNGGQFVRPATSSFDTLRNTQQFPSFQNSASMPRFTTSPHVGGVMLNEAAAVKGDESAFNLAKGGFSLVTEGENSRLESDAFRRFVTALWAVYYSKDDPGISIDPIAWGADKQLVRYIGRVVNTDLGRVMREADYTMKKWAVGTEKPDFPGFKDVDSYCGMKGLTYADAFRRFWFVPSNMTFKASDAGMIFDSGKVLLKTEFMLQNQSTRAADCDQEFADFFTQHYTEIATKYPIYGELFEYAKLVSLAKYLKEKGIPLEWFLLANLDQVLTEDSKGAVDTLSKGSQFLKDFRIEGGVDMPGKYVLDQTAATAIRQAMARVEPQRATTTRLGQAEARQTSTAPGRSFEFEKRNYSIVPQHSLSSGEDLNGVRYQTDIALRGSNAPGLELVRYFSLSNPGEPTAADFGKGWRLLIPFRAFPLGPPKIQFLNILVPERCLVKNLLNGREEVLVFDDKKYDLAGYRPINLTNSEFLGMFWTGGGGLRLADKIGNEFWFDGAGVLQEMHFSEDFGVRYEYDYEDAKREAFPTAPYLLSVVGTNVEGGFTVELPSKLKLTEQATGRVETFHFGTNQDDVIGYLSDNIVLAQRRFIALRRDGTHVLEEPNGNEILFDIKREFVKQRNVVITRMAQGHYQWNDTKKDVEFVENHSVRFNHQFAEGRFVINSAQLFQKTDAAPILTVNYDYSKDWTLAKVSSSSRN